MVVVVVMCGAAVVGGWFDWSVGGDVVVSGGDRRVVWCRYEWSVSGGCRCDDISFIQD